MFKLLKECAAAVIEASIIAVILYFVFWPLSVEGYSMEPTFRHNDRIFISKLPILLNNINRGDIVVFVVKKNNHNKKIIKRVIGVAGDHILIKDGQVFLNGIFLDEPYSIGETSGFIDITVSDKSIFVLGDNREISVDSRNLGCILNNNIMGKVLFRLLSMRSEQL